MGYYSDVTIRCEEKAYEMFEEAWKKVDFKPCKVYETNESNNHTYVLQWIGVKWYYEFDEVELICTNCNKKSMVNGYISEYPLGAFNGEEIKVAKLEEEE